MLNQKQISLKYKSFLLQEESLCKILNMIGKCFGKCTLDYDSSTKECCARYFHLPNLIFILLVFKNSALP